MKQLIAILLICVLVPCVYGETINYGNGDRYVGEVKNGKFHGHGIFTWAEDGRKYVGDFKNSEMHGQATLVFPNGDRLVGEWRNNEYWSAIAYDANGAILGTVTNGEWCEGCKPESTATASNSTALNSSYVWCATQTAKFQTTKDYCKSRGGKVFSTESQAKAEQQGLKGGTSSSSTTAAATAPSPSPRKVWCATKANYSVESSKSECENLGGKDFSHNSDGYRLAKAEHERLKVCSSRPPTRSSYEPWVWCATKVDYFVESSRSKCENLGGKDFSHDNDGRRLAKAEHDRRNGRASTSLPSAGSNFTPPCEIPKWKSLGRNRFGRQEIYKLKTYGELARLWCDLPNDMKASQEARRVIANWGRQESLASPKWFPIKCNTLLDCDWPPFPARVRKTIESRQDFETGVDDPYCTREEKKADSCPKVYKD